MGANSTGLIPNPLWSYSLGLEQGWIPKDPRGAVGACDRIAAELNLTPATSVAWSPPLSAWMTGGSGANTMAAAATSNYTAWPVTTLMGCKSFLCAVLRQNSNRFNVQMPMLQIFTRILQPVRQSLSVLHHPLEPSRRMDGRMRAILQDITLLFLDVTTPMHIQVQDLLHLQRSAGQLPLQRNGRGGQQAQLLLHRIKKCIEA